MKKAAKALLITGFWLVVWALAAFFTHSPLLLPGPVTVLLRLWALMGEASFWMTAGVSLLRIYIGAAAGILLGVLLAGLTYRLPWLDALLTPVLTLIRSTPVASFILLLLVWLGRGVLPSVIVVLMVLPVVFGAVSGGLSALDADLLELARVYRLGRLQTLRRVVEPSLRPHLLSGCRTALGLAWKAGIAAEVLTVPRASIGRHLYEAKLYLETTDLFAWTLLVIVLSLLLEKLLSALTGYLERRGRK